MAADLGFITNYSDLTRLKKRTPTTYARHFALTSLSLIANKKYLELPRIQFLYIHHLFEDEEKKLDDLMKLLGKSHEFISYSEAVNKVLSGTIDKPYITFSSDDGFKNNLRAAEILNEYGAKACFFVNPGIIGETDYGKLEQYCTGVLRFPVVEFLNWDEVAQLQKWGHEIGSHTMMHMEMGKATPAQIADDLGLTMKILNARCGGVKHFAFPYGRFMHFSSAGRKAVFDAGFTSCATAERGCHINSPALIHNTDLCIRRDHTVLGWDMNHILYFLINNAKHADINNNYFPDILK
jgi:peptidoglycan/xylan/chitin deacetylase (PgdA/CDA1 family)